MLNEISNETVVSISLVIISLLFLLFYILKLSRNFNLEVIRLKTRSDDHLKNMAAVSRVKISFSVCLDQSSPSEESTEEKQFFEISSSVSVNVGLYYYVAIDEIRKLYQPTHPHFKGECHKMLKNSLELLSAFQSQTDSLLANNDTNPSRIEFGYSRLPQDISMKIMDLDEDEESLSKKFVPIVLLVSATDTESCVKNNDIVAMASVVVKRKRNFEIIEQYIQTVDNRVIPLKHIFDAGVTQPRLTPSAPDLDPSVGGEQICVVCHEYPVTRVILPCRHACLCKLCFAKVDACPMCRVVIQSFFLIRSEDDLPHTEEEVRNEIRDDIHNMGLWNFIKSVWNAG